MIDFYWKCKFDFLNGSPCFLESTVQITYDSVAKFSFFPNKQKFKVECHELNNNGLIASNNLKTILSIELKTSFR